MTKRTFQETDDRSNAPASLATRDLLSSDAKLAAALHRDCFPDEPWHVEAFSDLLAIPGTFGFLASRGENPLGLLLCRAVADECEVLTLGVVATARRTGTGRALLGAGLERAATLGVGKVFLEVAVDNEAAIGLYHSSGFRRVAVRNGYYRRRDSARRVDAAVMSCSLGDR